MMKLKAIMLLLAALLLVAACGTPIDKAVEWSEDKTGELSDEIRGN